jgi:hypothetical protein
LDESTRLSQLTSSARRLALVGLAKNTGKTVALMTLLGELEAEGRRVGVTSVGRDGEERDVIDSRIEKPRVLLPSGSLVATTDGLLRASGLPHEMLEETGLRTPLGRVTIARLRGPGAIEVAGPSAAADVRAVADAMLGYGAEQVLIDGAVDRRAASSPEVSDALVMSTGAVLGEDIDDVVTQTSDAVALARLPELGDGAGTDARVRAIAEEAAAEASSVLLAEDEDSEPVALPARFALSADGAQIAELLEANPTASSLILSGALPDAFVGELAHALRRRRRELTVLVSDSTKVFLWKRAPRWYRDLGLQIQVLHPIEVHALTVNPVAPQAHGFDSSQLRESLQAAIPDVPVFDVLHPDYLGAPKGAPPS